MEQHTVEEWYSVYPDPTIKDQLFTNLRAENAQRLVDSMADAINMGFTWEDAPEGDLYWMNLQDESYSIEYNPIEEGNPF